MNPEPKTIDPRDAREFFERKMQFTTGPVELDHQIADHADLVVVDVRAAEDFEQGHIPGAINLTRGKWSGAEGLSKEKPNVLCCYSHVCHLAAAAAVEFAGLGYPVMEMDGGFEAWKENGLKIEKSVATLRREDLKAMSA